MSSHLHLGLPKGLFPVGLPVKIFENTPTFLHSGSMPNQHILYYLIHVTMQNLQLLEFLPEAFQCHVHHFHD